MHSRIIAIAATLALAGCAGKPIVSVSESGGPPAPGRYRIADGDGALSPLAPSAAAQLATRLSAHGWQAWSPEAAGTPPDVLLVAAVERRPAKIGLFSRRDPQDKAEAPGWIDTPDRRRKAMTRVTLRFVDPASGAPVRTAEAHALHGNRPDDALLERLIDAAITGRDPAVGQR